MKKVRILGILFCLSVLLALTFGLASCSTPDPENIDISDIVFEDKTVTYDGSEQKIEISGTLPEGVSVSYSGNTGTNAGTYTATATLSGEGYNSVELTATLTISKADVTGIEFNSASFVYDGTEKKLEISGELPTGVTVSYESASATNAGTYQASATLSGSNYNELTLNASLVIGKADISGISFAGGSFTYDGTEKKIEITGTLPEGVSVSYTDAAKVDAGTYTATVTVSGDNYKTWERSATLVIEKATITGISFESATYTYDGTEKSLTSIDETLLPDGAAVQYSAALSATDAGSYPITATINAGNNYNAWEKTVVLTINRGSLNIENVVFEDKTFTYDGTAKSVSVDASTLPAEVEINVEYAGNDRINAGTYTVIATLSNANYETQTLTATLTINKAIIDTSNIYLEDAEYTYDGTLKGLTLVGINNIPAGVTRTDADVTATNAGTYNATVTLSGDNYVTATITGTLVINKADITGVVFEDATFRYKANSYHSLVATGIPEGVTATYTNNSHYKVGEYTVTVILTGDNYNTLELTAVMTIDIPSSGGGITTPEHVWG